MRLRALAALAGVALLLHGPRVHADDAALASADLVSGVVARARALEHGEGVPKDQLRAAALYCEAARLGDAEALYSLGWMYANGRGVPRDDATAAGFFARAAERGHAQAVRVLAFITATAGPLPDCMRPPAIVTDLLPVIATPDRIAALTPSQQAIAGIVRELAPRYAVDPRLALAIIATESNFVATAQSPKGARGLMQLVPDTAARFGVRDAFDVRDNLRGGLAYLRYLLAYYHGQVALAAAAYNAGENAVDRHGGVPPYAETVAYVQRVRHLFGQDTHPWDATVGRVSPIVVAP